ncbi:MAG: YkvA family protein [Cyanobacteria bacterium P01_A01_bin.105]
MKNTSNTNNALIQALQDGYRKLLRHSKYRWIVVLGTLLYLVSPLDISPDVFPIVGWIDDGLIATLLVTEVSQLVSEQLKSRRNQHANTEEEPETTITADIVDVEAIPVA